MKKFITLGAVILTMFTVFANAGDYTKKLSVKGLTQGNSYWCAVATVTMWADWLEKPGILNNQYPVAVEAYGKKDALKPPRGMGTRQMADVLEEFSSNWFGSYNTTSKNRFIYKIARSIKNGKPVAIPVSTRYKGKPYKNNGHYILATGYKSSSSKNSYDYRNVIGFYVKDPAYNFTLNKPYITNIKVQRPDRVILKKELFSEWVTNAYRNRYYMVLD